MESIPMVEWELLWGGDRIRKGQAWKERDKLGGYYDFKMVAWTRKWVVEVMRCNWIMDIYFQSKTKQNFLKDWMWEREVLPEQLKWVGP